MKQTTDRPLSPREEYLNEVARWAGQPGSRPCPICGVALGGADTIRCGNDQCPIA